jgi:hypothetical protein
MWGKAGIDGQWFSLEELTYTDVILKDFSPEGSGAQRHNRREGT